MTAAQATNDFSTGKALLMGGTDNAGRYMNGMIGEVRIYDAALSSNDFIAARTEMANTWIGYRLTVTSGSGSGTYGDGQSVPIVASNLTGKAFVAWTGDTQYLAGAVSSASNTVIMPTNAVTLTATYVDTIYTLTVNNGSGSGTYDAGVHVPITANPVNPPNTFLSWIGDTQYLSGAATSASNTVTMPSNAVTLTATYLLTQHLTATNSASVITNSSGVVSQWTDQSGSGNHAVSNGGVGSVYYPGTSLSAGGKAGLDFGTNLNTLVALNAVTASNVLNSANGFAVMIAFKADSIHTNDWNDVIGCGSTTVGFGMRYGMSGAMTAYLADQTVIKSGSVAAGDTVVYGFNYDDTTLAYEFWDSKDGKTATGALSTNQAAKDFSAGNALTLGAMKTSGIRYMDGMIGEVRIYGRALTTNEFLTAQTEMNNSWLGLGGMLTVNSGSGGGWGTNGQHVAITANTITGKTFTAWTGDTQYLAGAVSSASNTVIMSTNPVNLTATYTDGLYVLTVTGGSGGGSYTNGHVQAIAADVISGKTFTAWTGDTAYLDNSNSASATVTMPAQAVAVTATYTDNLYTLTVNNGSGSGSAYTNGQVVPITADAPASGYAFAAWTGDTAYLADSNAASTTVTMPAQSVAVTATYIATEQYTTNGTPYSWLTSYGLTNYEADAVLDQDNDGLKAWQEYIAGTNPTNAASVLKAAQATRNVVTWSAVSGRVYSVYWSTNLVKGFTNLANNATSPYTNTTPDSRVNHYQIKVQLQQP